MRRSPTIMKWKCLFQGNTHPWETKNLGQSRIKMPKWRCAKLASSIRLLGLVYKDTSEYLAAVPPPSSHIYIYICLRLQNDTTNDAEEGNQNKEERQTVWQTKTRTIIGGRWEESQRPYKSHERSMTCHYSSTARNRDQFRL